MLESGLPLEYIDEMGLQDQGDVMAFWSGKAKGEEKLRKLSSKGKGGA